MANPIKPLLYNGFKVSDSVSVKHRIERVFFTEVYLLSNDKYLYLFTNLKSDDVVSKEKLNAVLKLDINSKLYLGLIVDEHSNSKVSEVVDELTLLRGFDCIAGMEDLKKLLRDEVIGPLVTPERFKKFKISIPNGILLFGPPGCGKTFIVKKLAEELNYNFIEMNPSSIATSYVHGAVGNIGKAFDIARQNAPSIIFIDEIDGLLPKREELGSHADTKKEEINEFLIQLNNAGQNRVLVVGATNRPHMIDSAIMRSGRMDKRVYIPEPDFEARKGLFQISLSGRPYSSNLDFDKLATMTEHFVSSDITEIVNQAARQAAILNYEMIDQKQLEDCVKKSKPSITIEELNYFKQFLNLERW